MTTVGLTASRSAERQVGDPFGGSVWNQGAAAARSGLLSVACPYHRLSYDFVVWHNGWAWASHMKAKEDFDL